MTHDKPKPYFLNFRTRDEMSWPRRWLWRILGKQQCGFADDYAVTTYSFLNVTLIWKVELVHDRP